MPILYCTKSLFSRARIKANTLEPPASHAILGDWYSMLVPTRNGNLVLYMSDKTLLTFIFTEGERLTVEKLFLCFLQGLQNVLPALINSLPRTQAIIDEYSSGLICRAKNASLLGSLADFAVTYAQFVDDDGGIGKASIGDLVFEVNQRPCRRLGGLSPWEVTAQLLQRPQSN